MATVETEQLIKSIVESVEGPIGHKFFTATIKISATLGNKGEIVTLQSEVRKTLFKQMKLEITRLTRKYESSHRLWKLRATVEDPKGTQIYSFTDLI